MMDSMVVDCAPSVYPNTNKMERIPLVIKLSIVLLPTELIDAL